MVERKEDASKRGRHPDGMIQREFFYTPTFDGGWYPGILDQADAVVGKEPGGLRSLLVRLEQHLGLAGGAVSFPERIVLSTRSVRKYLDKCPQALFAESFALDSIAVAKRLLLWRDELLLHGWKGDESVLPPRLKEGMEALSSGPDQVPPGIPDRIRLVLKELAERKEAIYGAMRLLCLAAEEPMLVRSLFDGLQETGTALERWSLPPGSKQKGDLKGVREVLLKGGEYKPRGDGTLIHLKGPSPFSCAEALASWLTKSDLSSTAVIAPARVRAELDAALRRYHLPGVGAAIASPLVSALQILPLALSLRWGPLDPEILLQFLQLPISPLPRKFGRRLAAAVAENPGIGGPLWKAVLEKCLEQSEKEPGLSRGKVEERFRSWLPDVARLIPIGKEMLAGDIADLCDRLVRWAVGRRSRREKPDEAEAAVLCAVEGQALLLKKLVELRGRPRISRIELSRLIDLATGDGLDSLRGVREAGFAGVVTSPAAVLGPVDTLVWWDFTGAGAETLPSVLFTAEEALALRRAGIALPDRGKTALYRSWEWRRPFVYAASRLVLVSHRLENGEPVGAHPLWNEIACSWKAAEIDVVTADPSDLLGGRRAWFGVETAALKPLPLPAPRRIWTLKRLRPELRTIESPKSLEMLSLCPLRYVLQYQAVLTPAEAVSLKSDALNLGTLAHRVLRCLFEEKGGAWDEETFEQILGQEGATYLLPGREDSLAGLKLSVRAAARKLQDLVRAQGLSIRGFETSIEGKTEIGLLKGRTDIILDRKGGAELILDVKYSGRGDRKYLALIAEGRAIQLAAYRRLMGDKSRAAYLSVGDGQFIGEPGLEMEGILSPPGPSLEEVWSAVRDTAERIIREQWEKHLCAALGVVPADLNNPDSCDPQGIFQNLRAECRYCDYSAVCGFIWQAPEDIKRWEKLRSQ